MNSLLKMNQLHEMQETYLNVNLQKLKFTYYGAMISMATG